MALLKDNGAPKGLAGLGIVNQHDLVDQEECANIVEEMIVEVEKEVEKKNKLVPALASSDSIEPDPSVSHESE